MITKAQLIVLKDLITTLGLTGTDDEVKDVLNAKTVENYRALRSSELNMWAAMYPGTRKAIFQASENYDSPYYDVCSAARFSLENTEEQLDMNSIDVRNMANALPITDEAKQALLAMSSDNVSPASKAGLPVIKTGYVYAARLLP